MMSESAQSPRAVVLGPYRDDMTRPSFTATHDGRSFIIELDSSAVFLVANRARDENVSHLLNQKRAIIRAAAERLIDQGFFITRDDAMVVVLSALDL